MSLTQYDDLKIILAGRESGSITIALRALKFISKVSHNSDSRAINMFTLMETTRPDMIILQNVAHAAQDLVRSGKSPAEACQIIQDDLVLSTERAARNALRFVSSMSTIATISRSEQLKVFFHKARRRLDFVYLFVSGKIKEEGLMRHDLAQLDIKSSILDITSARYAISNIDSVFVGSDFVNKDYFVNKVGTKALAKVSFQTGKPLYVLTTKWKMMRETKTSSPYMISEKIFERIPNSLVTCYITESGCVIPSKALRLTL